MKNLQRCRVLTPGLALASLPIKISFICRPPLQVQNVRHLSIEAYTRETLIVPDRFHYFRPILSKHWLTPNKRREGIDPKLMKSWREQEGYANEIRFERYQSTNIKPFAPKKVPWDNGEVVDYGKPWETAQLMRVGCATAFTHNWSIQSEIAARKTCAEIKDQRYPMIYRSLEKQAHILYIVGRIELEKPPAYHPFAWYILSIAAGLGQLDAALLLHKLEKYDRQFAVQAEQKAVIAKAAQARLDWRAMVAQCEHEASAAKGIGGRGKLQGERLVECLDMLDDAMSLAQPSTVATVERDPPPEGFLDPETLEQFDPPHKTLLAISRPEIIAGNTSEKVITLFEKAARTGAFEYNDPEAAWEYALWYLTNKKDYTEECIHCLIMAATAGNPDACFQLAKYCFHRDGWHPSITSRELDNAKGSSWRGDQDQELKLHDMILRGRNDTLLRAQDGIYWMEIAASLHIDSATKMLNRYCIVAGLLRQNGFLSEGRAVLVGAQQQLKQCVGNQTAISKALQVLDEYLEFWDKRLVHQLLDPESINSLLDSLPKM